MRYLKLQNEINDSSWSTLNLRIILSSSARGAVSLAPAKDKFTFQQPHSCIVLANKLATSHSCRQIMVELG